MTLDQTIAFGLAILLLVVACLCFWLRALRNRLDEIVFWLQASGQMPREEETSE